MGCTPQQAVDHGLGSPGGRVGREGRRPAELFHDGDQSDDPRCSPWLWWLPSGYVKIAIDHGHRNSGFTHKNGDFP